MALVCFLAKDYVSNRLSRFLLIGDFASQKFSASVSPSSSILLSTLVFSYCQPRNITGIAYPFKPTDAMPPMSCSWAKKKTKIGGIIITKLAAISRLVLGL